MNTSNHTDIQQVRRALERFYDGSSTPADEALLESYFTGMPEAAMDSDLAAEARVYKALSALRSSTQDFAPPAGLEERILAATCGAHKSVISRRRLFASLGTAATVAILLGLGIALRPHYSPSGSLNFPATETPIIAVDSQTDSTPTSGMLSMASIAPAPDIAIQPALSTPDNKKAKEVPARPKKRAKRPMPTPEPSAIEEKSTDNYIEINDPLRAVDITQDIFMLLASNLSTATDAIETTNVSLSSVNQTIAAVIDEKLSD